METPDRLGKQRRDAHTLEAYAQGCVDVGARPTAYDVFNGDADGLCSLKQLRLAQPCESVLVTGPKREIALLARVDAVAGDVVSVLDVSMAVNRDALSRLLARGVRVRYFDHHHAGAVPDHPLLDAHLDFSADVCTAMLVDRSLGGAHRAWAIVAAFGDNLARSALALARTLALAERDVARLRNLGEALNYNGYGDHTDDLIVHPAALYRRLEPFADPLAFADTAIVERIAAQRRDDLSHAFRVAPASMLPGATIHVLPDEAWSRRARGAFANELANRAPTQAHAVLTPNRRGCYTVSLRTPGHGADALCREFPGGGGRAGAAGIDDLPVDALPAFRARLDRAFPG